MQLLEYPNFFFMAALIDLTGNKFNRLTVIAKGESNHRTTLWICKCDCGNIRIVNGRDLRSNHTKSCGCWKIEAARKRHLKHGESRKTPEYAAWCAMKNRCYNPKYPKFHNYGGRGIKVCDRWLNSFEAFLSDMGRRPTSKHSLDRFPNLNGNYEYKNCRWATNPEQANNKTSNRILKYKGIHKTQKEWAALLHIHETTIIRNLKKGKPFHEIAAFFEIKNRILI